MNSYYLTFGQRHPAKDGWIRVEAESLDAARELVIREYGSDWAHLYPREYFEPEYFCKGELGVLK